MVKRKVKKTAKKVITSPGVKRQKPLLKKRLRSLRSSKKAIGSSGKSQDVTPIKNGTKKLLDVANLNVDEELDYDDDDDDEENEAVPNYCKDNNIKKKSSRGHEVCNKNEMKEEEKKADVEDDENRIDVLNEHLKELDNLISTEADTANMMDSVEDDMLDETNSNYEERLLQSDSEELNDDNTSPVASPIMFTDCHITHTNDNIIHITRTVTNTTTEKNTKKFEKKINTSNDKIIDTPYEKSSSISNEQTTTTPTGNSTKKFYKKISTSNEKIIDTPYEKRSSTSNKQTTTTPTGNSTKNFDKKISTSYEKINDTPYEKRSSTSNEKITTTPTGNSTKKFDKKISTSYEKINDTSYEKRSSTSNGKMTITSNEKNNNTFNKEKLFNRIPLSQIIRSSRKTKKVDRRKWTQSTTLKDSVSRITFNDQVFHPHGSSSQDLYFDVITRSPSRMSIEELIPDVDGCSGSEKSSSLVNSTTSLSGGDSIFKLPVKKPPSHTSNIRNKSNMKPKFRENDDLDAISLYASTSVIDTMHSEDASECGQFTNQERFFRQDDVEETKNVLVDKWVEQQSMTRQDMTRQDRNWMTPPLSIFKGLCYALFFCSGCSRRSCKYYHNIPNQMLCQLKALDYENLLIIFEHAKSRPVLLQHIFDSLADSLSKFKHNPRVTYHLTEMIQVVLKHDHLDRTRFIEIIVFALLNFGLSFKESIDLIIMRCGATKTNFCDILLYLIVHEGNICDNWDLVKKLTIWRSPREKLDYNTVREMINYCANSNPPKTELYENILNHIINKNLVDLDMIHMDIEKCESVINKSKQVRVIQNVTPNYQPQHPWRSDCLDSYTEPEDTASNNYCSKFIPTHETRNHLLDGRFEKTADVDHFDGREQHNFGSDDFDARRENNFPLNIQNQLTNHESPKEYKRHSNSDSSRSSSSSSSSRSSSSFSSSSSSNSSRSSISRIRNKSQIILEEDSSKPNDGPVNHGGDHFQNDYNINSNNSHQKYSYDTANPFASASNYRESRPCAEPNSSINSYVSEERYVPQPKKLSNTNVDSLQQYDQMNRAHPQYIPSHNRTFTSEPHILDSSQQSYDDYTISDDLNFQNSYNRTLTNNQHQQRISPGRRSPLRYTTISLNNQVRANNYNWNSDVHSSNILDASPPVGVYNNYNNIDNSTYNTRENRSSSKSSRTSTHQEVMASAMISNYFGTLKLNPDYICNISLHNWYHQDTSQGVEIDNGDIPLLQRCIHSGDHKWFLKLFGKYKSPTTIQSFILHSIVFITSYGNKSGNYGIFIELRNQLDKAEAYSTKELKATIEVIAFNLVINAVRRCFWDDIDQILQKFSYWDSLITSKVFAKNFDYTLMGRYMVICKCYMKANNFHWPNEILQSDRLNILRSPFYWPYDRNDRADIALRAVVLNEFFSKGYKYNISAINDLYKFISKLGDVEGFNTWHSFNGMLNCILDNWKENQNAFKILFKDIVNTYFEYIDPNILRAAVIFAQGKFNDEEVRLLYTKCCTKNIYCLYEGNETHIIIKNNMLDQEIAVMLDCYFHNMYKKWLRPPDQLIIEVKLAGVSCSYPEILKNSTRSIKDLCTSLRDVLRRMGILNFREDGTFVHISHQSLLHYYKYLTNKYTSSHRHFLS